MFFTESVITTYVKIKSAGTTLNIAENAKISESALKMTKYLWELSPGIAVNLEAFRYI